MALSRLNMPVAFLIFNRPETTAQVFEQIRQARPAQLLVVADGPRPDRPWEAEKCARTRAVVEQVDWPCEVLKNYSDLNLGCKRRVSSGLDWVFGTVNEAIILEDDCLPHPTFFRFCEELLERYRDDERVMHISGDNFQLGRKRGETSYYFSRYPHIWGWASWRRAWRHYDVNLSQWLATSDESVYLQQFESPDEKRFWRTVWDKVCAGKIDTWDFQWAFACMVRSGLSIMPAVNLISNIGFGVNFTNTSVKDASVANLPTEGMPFPLTHPDVLTRDVDADESIRHTFFARRHVLERVLGRVDRGVRSLFAH